ncbi:hypothetical protein ASD11_01220 [Aeromicrobium sp. Root495]|uniref:hypothetical protein n=1 Tax=Aeromicrobium sp. Root495 TaxID=1736550 RepID=UPI0006F93584|nr:hypothetical protein [Aeromicrobium sp. Root495]KQY58316.1 hypothetical protein ASD11_01220 [Aeromicrobium sp. Root495]
MAKVASFADVEDLLTTILASVGTPVASRLPDELPDEFVRVIRTGGAGRVSRISELATVVVEAFAQTEADALALLRACAEALAEAEGTKVAGVLLKTVTELSGPGNLPTPSVPRSRYTQTFDLHLKGTTP